jgi:hypothetical protein
VRTIPKKIFRFGAPGTPETINCATAYIFARQGRSKEKTYLFIKFQKLITITRPGRHRPTTAFFLKTTAELWYLKMLMILVIFPKEPEIERKR